MSPTRSGAPNPVASSPEIQGKKRKQFKRRQQTTCPLNYAHPRTACNVLWRDGQIKRTLQPANDAEPTNKMISDLFGQGHRHKRDLILTFFQGHSTCSFGERRSWVGKSLDQGLLGGHAPRTTLRNISSTCTAFNAGPASSRRLLELSPREIRAGLVRFALRARHHCPSSICPTATPVHACTRGSSLNECRQNTPKHHT